MINLKKRLILSVCILTISVICSTSAFAISADSKEKYDKSTVMPQLNVSQRVVNDTADKAEYDYNRFCDKKAGEIIAKYSKGSKNDFLNLSTSFGKIDRIKAMQQIIKNLSIRYHGRKILS